MKFEIKRTSLWNDNIPPCENAYSEEAITLDRRTVSTIHEAKSRDWFNSWYNGGTNHREEDGMIVCDRKDKSKRWFIDVNSLDDLINLSRNNDASLILSTYTNIKDVSCSVEIYDDYRE